MSKPAFGLFTLPYGTAAHAVVQNYVSATDLPLNLPEVPARPLQVLIAYGTGLGPITAPDNLAPPAEDFPGLDLDILVGGVAARRLYAGRSSCCAGLDQVAFELAANTPSGCELPLVFQSGSESSAEGVVSVSADGGACKPADPAIQVQVPGTADLWLAGMPDGSGASVGDFAPTHSPARVTGLTLTPGAALRFSAAGGVTHDPGQAVVSPDGSAALLLSHFNGPENGISDTTAPVNALIGVFLDATQPNLSQAPAALDFSTAESRDYPTLTPALKQVFFIGDGLTSGAVQQEVITPQGATRLFLGTMDAFGWWNNSGSFAVTVVGTR